jgi:type IV secretory pathway VirJ component
MYPLRFVLLFLLAFINIPFTNAQTDILTPPKDMVLKVIPSIEKNNLPFVFFISGDGGWTKFDQLLSEALAKKGLNIIGLNSKKYFWNPKTPESTTADVSTAIAHYQKLWNKKSFILIGYSFGADVIPFIANRMTTSLRDSLNGVLALSPDRYSDFEVRIGDLLHLTKSTKYDVLAEFKNIKAFKAIAYFGSEEDIDLRNHFINEGVNTILLTGNHHFNYNYGEISESLFKAIVKN